MRPFIAKDLAVRLDDYSTIQPQLTRIFGEVDSPLKWMVSVDLVFRLILVYRKQVSSFWQFLVVYWIVDRFILGVHIMETPVWRSVPSLWETLAQRRVTLLEKWPEVTEMLGPDDLSDHLDKNHVSLQDYLENKVYTLLKCSVKIMDLCGSYYPFD